MQPVAATPVDELVSASPAGAISFYGNDKHVVVGMHFKCPCGCGAVGGVRLEPGNPHSWNWDGNLEKPTISPSIGFDRRDDGDRFHWHGYLRNGIWESC